MQVIEFTLNGGMVRVPAGEGQTLLELLRDTLELTGTKEGCGSGDCGACTVLLNNRPVNSCLVLAVEADGQDVITIEGLSMDGVMHPIQQAFVEEGAVQCGFCTPGMILTAKAILDENPKSTEEEIRRSLAGNLCRCTGYAKIIKAIKSVSQKVD